MNATQHTGASEDRHLARPSIPLTIPAAPSTYAQSTLSPVTEEAPFDFTMVPSPVASPPPTPPLSPRPSSALPFPPPAQGAIWPRALALTAGSTALQLLVRQVPKAGSLLAHPFGAVCCWGASASFIVGDRLAAAEDRQGLGYNVARSLRRIASLAFWTLPLFVRSHAPLARSAIGIRAALGTGVAVALGIWAGRSFFEPRAQNATRPKEPAPDFDDWARLGGSLAFVLPLQSARRGMTLLALGAVLAGVYIGLRDTGHPDGRAPLAPTRVAEETDPWRQARDQAITGCDLAARITLALRLIFTLV